MPQPTELACDILQRTNDGDDLAPEHLYLLQLVVNGAASDSGKMAFTEVHKAVMEGLYSKPWLQGIEHLTRDHEGYVYWKGHHVEHWSGDLPFSEEGRQQALELERRCKLLEVRGETPTCARVIWGWRE